MTTPLPPISDFTGSTVTEGGVKTFFTSMRQFLSDLLGTTGASVDARKALGVPGNEIVVKSGAYTVVAADCGKTIRVTGTTAVTLSFSAAATLGNGFTCSVFNDSTQTVTLDPNLAEIIDGAATRTISSGGRLSVSCDAAALYTDYQAPPVTSFNARTGAVTLTSGDVTTALGYTPTSGSFVAKDNGSLAVGSYALCVRTAVSAVADGGTCPGSELKATSLAYDTSTNSFATSAALTGTWRNVSGVAMSGSMAVAGISLFQRIA